MLPILLLTVPILSLGPLAVWTGSVLVLRRRRHSAALRPYVLYHIEDGRLIYRSGLRWGHVSVDRIWRITCGATARLANASVSHTGLRIQFFTGEAFIAPQHEAAFITELRRINPNIVVKEAKR